MTCGTVGWTLRFEGDLDEFTSCLYRALECQGCYELYGHRVLDGPPELVITSQESDVRTRQWTVELFDDVAGLYELVSVSGDDEPLIEQWSIGGQRALIDARQVSGHCIVSFFDGRAGVSEYDVGTWEPLGGPFDRLVDMIAQGVSLWRSAVPFIGGNISLDKALPAPRTAQVEGQAGYLARRRRRADLFKELKSSQPALTQKLLAREAQRVEEERIGQEAKVQNPNISRDSLNLCITGTFRDTYGQAEFTEDDVRNDWRMMAKAGEVSDWRSSGPRSR